MSRPNRKPESIDVHCAACSVRCSGIPALDQWVLLPDGWQMWWRGVWRARSCVPIGARVVCSWECAEKLAR